MISAQPLLLISGIYVIRDLNLSKLDNEHMENEPRVVIEINPPPSNNCCECCGRHVREIKPFDRDKANTSGVGALLVKNFRFMAPSKVKGVVELTPDVLNENGDVDDDKLIAKYGKVKVDQFYLAEQLAWSTTPSWECRDCFTLPDDEYFKRKLGKTGE